MSGPWLTPFVAAVKLSVPYFFVEYVPQRMALFKKVDFKPIVTLIGSNCPADSIINFISSVDKAISAAKVEKNNLGLYFIFIFNCIRIKETKSR